MVIHDSSKFLAAWDVGEKDLGSDDRYRYDSTDIIKRINDVPFQCWKNLVLLLP